MAAIRDPSGSLVLPLEEIDQRQKLLAGGKAANLGMLIQAGLPVPPGFCLTTTAFALFLDGCDQRDYLAVRLQQAGETPVDKLAELSREIQQCLAVVEMPSAVRDAALAAWRTLGEQRDYAVRSSATMEDARERSFAGQFDSILRVRGPAALLNAIKQCWLSLFSARALVYQRKHGLFPGKAAMAVIVQEMVAADISGVVFTADPVSGDRSRFVVEWVHGGGEALVQGTVCPERIEMAKDNQGRKQASGLDNAAAAGIPAALGHLLDLATQTERLFQTPQDIEWAQQKGALFLLQARPITTLGVNSEGSVQPVNEPEVWSNLNVVENLPHALTPLAWSVLEYILNLGLGPLAKIVDIDPARNRWFGQIAGRAYFNVGACLKILGCIPGFRPDQLAWFFGGHQDALMEAIGRLRPASGSRKRLHAQLQVWFRFARLAWLSLRWATWRSPAFCLARFRELVNRFDQMDFARLPDDDLLTTLNRLSLDVMEQFCIPVAVSAGTVCHTLLRRGCHRWFGDPHGAMANQLISRAGGLESAEPALELWRLAAWIYSQETVCRCLRQASNFAGLSAALPATDAGREFLQRWQAFLKRHGHHCRGEVDVGIARWVETPDEVLQILQHYLDHMPQFNWEQKLAQRTSERARLLADCQRRLGSRLARWWLAFLVRQTQDWVSMRENSKNELVRLLAIARRIFLELGERLARRGLITTRDDLFFLTLEELGPVLRGAPGMDMPAVIRTRREELLRYQELEPPSVIVGQFDPARHRPVAVTPGLRELKGLPVSAGVATGPARVILHPDSREKVLPGEILIAPFTDPGWTPLFLTAAGLVTDLGGQLSHGSVIAREYGLPAVVNVQHATRIIRTGQLVRVDGNQGLVMVLSESSP